MESIEVRSWEEFEEKLQEKQATAGERSSHFLYRGQTDSGWELDTTLERRGKRGVLFTDYYKLLWATRAQIEAFTGMKWDIPTYPEVLEQTKSFDSLSWKDIPAYDYLVHLRHHGFPSPLLDWSRSQYVAAFFAFRSAVERQSGWASIYVFWERPEGMKGASSDQAQIRGLGPYVRTHRRHFLQQAEYTICITFADGTWRFSEHQEVFARGDNHQDVVWKFDIPASERLKVLKLLDNYNLNAFSLFQTEDSLMETTAFREMDLRNRP